MIRSDDLIKNTFDSDKQLFVVFDRQEMKRCSVSAILIYINLLMNSDS